MTIEAPVHRQRRYPVHARHVLHLAVTGCARNSILHVHAVVKVHEVGKVVHALPGDGRILEGTLAHRGEKLALCPDLIVAADARRRWRDARVAFALCSRMAVQARDAVIPDVVTMIELNGLFECFALMGSVSCANVDHRCSDRCAGRNQADTQDRQVGCIRPARKESRHGRERSVQPAGHVHASQNRTTLDVCSTECTTSERACCDAGPARERHNGSKRTASSS